MSRLYSLTLNKIKTFESNLIALSHDELRARTSSKIKLQVARAEIDAKIATLKKDVEAIEDIARRHLCS
jgi:preprotein translocase subunit SecA